MSTHQSNTVAAARLYSHSHTLTKVLQTCHCLRPECCRLGESRNKNVKAMHSKRQWLMLRVDMHILHRHSATIITHPPCLTYTICKIGHVGDTAAASSVMLVLTSACPTPHCS